MTLIVASTVIRCSGMSEGEFGWVMLRSNELRLSPEEMSYGNKSLKIGVFARFLFDI